MGLNDLVVLGGRDVENLLAGREREVMDAVARAYLAHGRGESSLPHSLFLRFPGNERDRIIALPAYLGDGFDVAGLKWIASVPGNLERGLERASAVIILNSPETGRPEAILEGSIISARRTAASAALAAREFHGPAAPEAVGLVGCGLISSEIARFLRAVWPEAGRFLAFDLDPARAGAFAARLEAAHPGTRVEVAPSLSALLAACPLVAFATTAGKPHVADLSACPPGATILHVSLRDLAPEVILASDNVVDDADHVCRAETSVHLAEKATGNRDFIRCSLADILAGRAPARREEGGIAVFSPFGLGVLDLALAKLVRDGAAERGLGTVVGSFLPG